MVVAFPVFWPAATKRSALHAITRARMGLIQICVIELLGSRWFLDYSGAMEKQQVVHCSFDATSYLLCDGSFDQR